MGYLKCFTHYVLTIVTSALVVGWLAESLCFKCLKEYTLRMIQTKFGSNWPSGFREHFQKVVKQKEIHMKPLWKECLNSDDQHFCQYHLSLQIIEVHFFYFKFCTGGVKVMYIHSKHCKCIVNMFFNSDFLFYLSA